MPQLPTPKLTLPDFETKATQFYDHVFDHIIKSSRSATTASQIDFLYVLIGIEPPAEPVRYNLTLAKL
ncbi:hypothetical protein DSO57_1023901 [Entomophthora muscae]|uniref:Uncharacterized protein n=1 Tax=Entomophthora muscae TaxID=34485 RepID=A0ACC2SFT3_9FUNG|nr:hypothetical protein DSO57_1023901 [Entomophthora muscae]